MVGLARDARPHRHRDLPPAPAARDARRPLLRPGRDGGQLRALVAALREAQLEPAAVVAHRAGTGGASTSPFASRGSARASRSSAERFRTRLVRRGGRRVRRPRRAPRRLRSGRARRRPRRPGPSREDRRRSRRAIEAIAANVLPPLFAALDAPASSWYPTLGLGFLSGVAVPISRAAAAAVRSARARLAGGSAGRSSSRRRRPRCGRAWTSGAPPPPALDLMQRAQGAPRPGRPPRSRAASWEGSDVLRRRVSACRVRPSGAPAAEPPRRLRPLRLLPAGLPDVQSRGARRWTRRAGASTSCAASRTGKIALDAAVVAALRPVPRLHGVHARRARPACGTTSSSRRRGPASRRAYDARRPRRGSTASLLFALFPYPAPPDGASRRAYCLPEERACRRSSAKTRTPRAACRARLAQLDALLPAGAPSSTSPPRFPAVTPAVGRAPRARRASSPAACSACFFPEVNDGDAPRPLRGGLRGRRPAGAGLLRRALDPRRAASEEALDFARDLIERVRARAASTRSS